MILYNRRLDPECGRLSTRILSIEGFRRIARYPLKELLSTVFSLPFLPITIPCANDLLKQEQYRCRKRVKEDSDLFSFSGLVGGFSHKCKETKQVLCISAVRRRPKGSSLYGRLRSFYLSASELSVDFAEISRSGPRAKYFFAYQNSWHFRIDTRARDASSPQYAQRFR